MDLVFTKDKAVLQSNFSRGFSSFLDRKGLKTQDVAKALGVTDSAVSSWKKGRAFPDVPNLLRLVELGLSLTEISSGVYALVIINKINERQANIYQTERANDELKRQMQNLTDKKKIALWQKCIDENQNTIDDMKAKVLEYEKRITPLLDGDLQIMDLKAKGKLQK